MNPSPFVSRCGTTLRLACIVMLAAATAACAARQFDRMMHDWQGHNLRDLLSTWGPPRFVYSDGLGGYVLAYVPVASTPDAPARPLQSADALIDEFSRKAATTGQSVYRPATAAGWPVSRLFFVNEAGRIYGVEWRGKWECCGT